MITVPWPPSVNHYWRMHRGKVLISAEGRQYRNDLCKLAMMERWPKLGKARLKVKISAYPVDNRRRDLDNLLKGLLDGLESAAVYENDGQIDDLRIVRMPADPPGYLFVYVEEIT